MSEIVNGKHLIDTGPSPRGWHRLEAFLRCPRLYWLKHVRGPVPGATPADPLVRGSMGHAALAHHYVLKVAAARKIAADFHDPLTAIDLVADKYGAVGDRHRETVKAAVERYIACYVHEPYNVIGVERLRETSFEGFRYTARVDLEVEDTRKKVWFIDHKFVGRIEDKTFRRYALSGQFLGLQHLGRAVHGARFAGVLINVIGVNDRKMERRAPEPAPWAFLRFPHVVAETERQIASYEARGDDSWPLALSELVCFTPYGPCDAFESCRWGS